MRDQAWLGRSGAEQDTCQHPDARLPVLYSHGSHRQGRAFMLLSGSHTTSCRLTIQLHAVREPNSESKPGPDPENGRAPEGSAPGTQFATVRARMSRELLHRPDPEQVRRYIVIGLVFGSLELLLMWAGGVELPRLLALAFMIAMPIVFGLARRARPPSERDYVRGRLIFLINTGARLALTGGLHSPLLPVLGASIVQPILTFGPGRSGVRYGIWTLLMVIIVGLLPAEITGPTIEGWPYAALLVLSLVVALFIVGELIRINTNIQDQATEAIIALYDERVAEAEAHGRRLQSVGGKVAHELKNPLAAIKSLIQLMARGANDPRTQQRFDVVEGEIGRMEVILREYLSFSRPLEDLEPVTFDLAELARRVSLVISGRAEHAGVQLITELQAAPIVGDPQRLQEALLNLLANAVEATPPGGSIRVMARPQPEGGGLLEITDSGRGLSPEQLERLGTSFFTTRPDGNGLGVVLVLGVVAQHGGQVHFASELGRGTRVSVRLPERPAPLASSPTLLRSSSLRQPPPARPDQPDQPDQEKHSA
ncbi:HAMP domain-containing histidine kinase [Pseudenhygromyxa sp. WMMC2535]|uniref:sensor histidine kinase n=1 Tax=Pseudenhygromyxa sp. WMMC2535 TaxID=2712867 RepID=UPI0015962D2F|nr:HAMP domain-containing sensor histidine kinase [Pseudenhygromyxa sp. WMMC2535]NVB36563.1 HAMP domain-containing histidine kinase [Pseudenhygromyxa sp. WMMC2535]